MRAVESTHYLLTLAEKAPGGTGAAIELAVKRMLNELDYDGIELMAAHARISEMERRVSKVVERRP